jgi:hypothetical protein
MLLEVDSTKFCKTFRRKKYTLKLKSSPHFSSLLLFISPHSSSSFLLTPPPHFSSLLLLLISPHSSSSKKGPELYPYYYFGTLGRVVQTISRLSKESDAFQPPVTTGRGSS